MNGLKHNIGINVSSGLYIWNNVFPFNL